MEDGTKMTFVWKDSVEDCATSEGSPPGEYLERELHGFYDRVQKSRKTVLVEIVLFPLTRRGEGVFKQSAGALVVRFVFAPFQLHLGRSGAKRRFRDEPDRTK